MNNKTNYTFVGFVVVMGIVSLLAFSYWMLKPNDEAKEKTYIIYFTESVFGLNLNAPVKFRGINVGRVSKLRINPANSEEVEVQVSILASTPIKENVVAKLTAQGITGLTYINLTLGDAKPLQKVEVDGRMYRVIPTAPSFFKHFEQSFGSMSEEMTGALLQAKRLLNDENQHEFMQLINSSASVMQKIDKTLDQATIEHLQSSVKNIDIATAQLTETLRSVEKTAQHTTLWEDDIAHSLAGIMQSYKKIDKAMGAFQQAVQRGDFNVQEITSELVPTINTTLKELQDLIINLDRSLKELHRSPADILYKRQEIQKGPGE